MKQEIVNLICLECKKTLIVPKREDGSIKVTCKYCKSQIFSKPKNSHTLIYEIKKAN